MVIRVNVVSVLSYSSLIRQFNDVTHKTDLIINDEWYDGPPITVEGTNIRLEGHCAADMDENRGKITNKIT